MGLSFASSALLDWSHPVKVVLRDCEARPPAEAHAQLENVIAAVPAFILDIAVQDRTNGGRWLWACAGGRVESHLVADSLEPDAWEPPMAAWQPQSGAPEIRLIEGQEAAFPLRTRSPGIAELETNIQDYPIDVWIETLADAMRATMMCELTSVVEGDVGRFVVRIEGDVVSARPLFACVRGVADGGRRFARALSGGWDDERPVETTTAKISARCEPAPSFLESAPLTTGSPRQREMALHDLVHVREERRLRVCRLDDRLTGCLVRAARALPNQGPDYENLRYEIHQVLAKQEPSAGTDEFLRESLRCETERIARLISELAYQRPALLEALRSDLVGAAEAGDELYARRIKRCFKEALISPDPVWLASLSDALQTKVRWRL